MRRLNHSTLKVHWYNGGFCPVLHPSPTPRNLARGVGQRMLSSDPREVTCRICMHHMVNKGLLPMPKKKVISFKVTETEAAIIRVIARRAIRLASASAGWGHVDIAMDLTACHANGCRLDLERLAAADDSTLLHDVGGIRAHLDRDDNSPTGGKLLRCFLPKCRASAPAVPGLSLADIGGYHA